MTFEPYQDEMTPLTVQLTAYYRNVIAIHTDDQAVGACLICKVSRCEDWRSAVERLICAGERPTMPVAVAPAAPTAEDEPT